VRAVLDPNILISALLSPTGAPAQLLGRWLSGDFELVVSEQLLAELERALAYPKLRRMVTADEAGELVDLLRHSAIVAFDPPDPPPRSSDAGDDYLLALAETERALLVSGDQHLLALSNEFPILAARSFLERLAEE
jgi:uncharacterized protein